MKRTLLLLSLLLVTAIGISAQAVWTDYRQPFPGSGTPDDPYTIATAEQLAQLAYDAKNGEFYEGKVFVQTADIDLTKEEDGERVQWVPIYGFLGSFYGRKSWGTDADDCMHTITGLYINSADDAIGLFRISLGTFRDITIKNAELVSTVSNGFVMAGVLCANYMQFNAPTQPSFYNCSVSGSITFSNTANKAYVGGMAGLVNIFHEPLAVIQRCTSEVNINCKANTMMAGGIVGECDGVLSDCVYNGNLIVNVGSGYVGGIAGNLSVPTGTVDKDCTYASACVSAGSVKVESTNSEATYVGGIVGQLSSSTNTSPVNFLLHSCVSTAALSGNASIGGVAGRVDGLKSLLSHSVFAGTIDGSRARCAAGICASINDVNNEEHVSKCLMTGTMALGSNKSNCYALVGSPSGNALVTVANCYYDRTLCNAQAITATTIPHPTVFGLTTAELTTGQEADLSFLLSEEDYGFVLANGYYPRVYSTAKTDFLVDNNLASPQQYQKGAMLASLPVAMQQGDLAYDLVAPITAKRQTVMWTERNFNPATQQWEEQEKRYNCAVTLPTDAACVKVEELKATPLSAGSFTMTLSAGSLSRPVRFDIVTLGTVWDGTTASGLQMGSGTAADPYIIRTTQELAYVVQHNEADKYYRQLCDLWLNTRVVRDYAYVVDGSYENLDYNRQWLTGITWNGHYDGAGHVVNGMYYYASPTDNNHTYGLFGTINSGATVETLGVANSWIKYDWRNNFVGSLRMGLFAGACSGTVRGCLGCGIIDAGQENNRFSQIGGLCGYVSAEGLVEDCVAAVSMRYNYIGIGSFISRQLSQGKARHCLALAPIIYGGTYIKDDCEEDCHYPMGYRYVNTPGSEHYYNDKDDDMTALNEAFASSALWQTEQGYYPMLKAFAGSTIGKMMTLPFTPAQDDTMMGCQQQITFNPGGLTWETDNYSVELDSDMGVVTPLKTMSNYNWSLSFPFLCGWSADRKNLLVIGVFPNKTGVQPGIIFEDENARDVCLAAFDGNGDHVLTLRELRNATPEQTLTAFVSETAQRIKTFPEFRYFKSVTELTTQLQALNQLESIELPYALETISANAFNGCTALREVTLPAKVSTIGEHPFYGSGVENILVDKMNETYTSRDGLLFDKNDRLISYPNGRSGSITLSGQISKIAPAAIYHIANCDSIFIDAPNYWDMTTLGEGGIETSDGSMPMVYINDATDDQELLGSYLDDKSWEQYATADKLSRYYPLTVTSAKAATLHIGFDTELPQGLLPYIVSTASEDEGVAHLTRLTNRQGQRTNKVPWRTPIVIFAEAPGLYKLFPIDEELEPIHMYLNRLMGSNRDGELVYQEDAIRGNILTLGRNSQGTLGFFYYKGERIPPYRAFLTVNDMAAGKSLHLVIDSEANGLTAPQASGDTNWQTPTDGCQIFDLQGRPVSSPNRKGIYITRGRKVVVK